MDVWTLHKSPSTGQGKTPKKLGEGRQEDFGPRPGLKIQKEENQPRTKKPRRGEIMNKKGRFSKNVLLDATIKKKGGEYGKLRDFGRYRGGAQRPPERVFLKKIGGRPGAGYYSARLGKISLQHPDVGKTGSLGEGYFKVAVGQKSGEVTKKRKCLCPIVQEKKRKDQRER